MEKKKERSMYKNRTSVENNACHNMQLRDMNQENWG